MFLSSETDYQSDSEYYLQNEKYSSDEEEQIDVNLDKSKKISDINDLEKISDWIAQNNKIESVLTKYIKEMKWNDINKSGQQKIINLIQSDLCCGIPSRLLEAILPCSKSTISRYRNASRESDIIDDCISQVGRPAKLSFEQSSELIREATEI